MNTFKLMIFLIIGLSINTNVLSDSSAQDAAMKMVETLRLGVNIQTLGYMSAKRTTAYGKLIEKVGDSQADVLLKKQLDKNAVQYQSQWNKNLASSYAEFFKPEELESLAVKKNKSQYFDKLLDMQAMVGPSMREKSEELLSRYVKDSLVSALLMAEYARN